VGGVGLSPQVKAALFGRAIEHYASIMASGLVPAGARREFFACMVRDFRRYRPAEYRRPPGLRGVKTALIARGAYWAYALLTPLNQARVRARRILRALAGQG
jgi:CDP-glycerol glycerophosphotransferase